MVIPKKSFWKNAAIFVVFFTLTVVFNSPKSVF